MQRFRKIAIVALIVLAAIVVLQNTAAVSTRFLLWEISAPRAVLLAVTLLIGFVIGLLTAWRHGGARRSS
jgi:putative membrane protein